MTTFLFRFPAGQYHATPWGRHANEADVAWPPEPVRILRALVATWFRKLDHAAYPKAELNTLIEALSASAPEFRLPDAVHTHIRAFMPAPKERKLIFDAFYRLNQADELAVCWPAVVLDARAKRLAVALLASIGYLGRAESWVEARLEEHWEGQTNSRPAGSATPGGVELVEVTVPVTPTAWQEIRQANPKHARLLPAALAEALALDTSVWQNAGWSSPPPMQRIIYERPKLSSPPAQPSTPRARSTNPPRRPQAARFVLAARPLPSVEFGLRVAETMRAALMHSEPACENEVPPEFSGRDEHGPLRADPEHAHAFFLPEDQDRDGRIDHLIVYSRLGFSQEAVRRLQRRTRLHSGGAEWRIALEDIAAPGEFGGDSDLLATSREWVSASPYLKPKFDRRRPASWEDRLATYRLRLVEEWSRRYPELPPPAIAPLGTDRFEAPLGPGGALRSPLAFKRTRGRRGGQQPDTAGGFFHLTFPQPVAGPIALGWGAHFGLGLFRALRPRPT